MSAHELAKLLLEMPDETIFVQANGSLWNIKEVQLCECKAEIIISHEEF